MKNILNHDTIKELSQTSEEIKNFISNSPEAFNYALKNPELTYPVKNTGKFNTHNFIIHEIRPIIMNKVVFIINCDLLFNDANGGFNDVAILFNNDNINIPIQNLSKNLSLAYRITACSFEVKARKSRCELQYLKNFDNFPINGLTKIINGNAEYYNQGNKQIKFNINFDNLKFENRLIFPFPIKEYYKPKEIPYASYYFIFECEDCEMFKFYKHIEHIPLQEYQEVLNVSCKEFL